MIHNQVDGNQRKGTSLFAASAILLFRADASNVSQNDVRGNSDVGIYIDGDDAVVKNNRVFDEGADDLNSCCDVGILSSGADNAVKNNKVRGFEVPYDAVTGGKNKEIPDPQK